MTAPLAPEAWNEFAERQAERSDAPFQLGLGIADLDLVVRTDLASELVEIAAMLLPHLEPRPRSATGWVVSLTAAPQLPAANSDGQDIVIAHSVGYPPLRGRAFARGGWRWVLNPRSHVLIGAHRDTRRIAVLRCGPASGHGGAASVDTHAAVRLVMRAHLAARGALVLHAAVVRMRGVGVALLGGKGSGKSTLQLALLARERADYIAGDRCFVYLERGRLTGCGWPSTLRPTARALELVPGGRALLDAAQLRSLGPDDKIDLAPADAARRLGIATPVTTELHVLLGPRYERRGVGWRLTRAGGAKLVDDHCFPTPDPSYPDWLALQGGSATASCTAATRDALRRLPAFDLSGGGPLDEECAAVDAVCSASFPTRGPA